MEPLKVGKFKNIPIRDVPSSYLWWLRTAYLKTVSEIDEEFEARRQENYEASRERDRVARAEYDKQKILRQNREASTADDIF